MPAIVLAVAALAAACAPAAAAKSTTETASLGAVQAQLSYQTGSDFSFHNVRVSISRNGTQLVNQQLKGLCRFCTVSPADGGQPGAKSISVLDLDGEATEPEVVVDLFTGGAHCCFYSVIYYYVPATNSYQSLTHEWLDPGYQFADLDGNNIPEFVSADGRFAYRFGPFADSRFPPQIWNFQNGALVDVTRQYPQLIKHDLARETHSYQARRKTHRLGVGTILAAVVADRCLLDQCSRGFGLVKTAIRRGDLSRDVRFSQPPYNHRYLQQLRRFLGRLGYT
jgi:hypothetical protein